VHNVRLEGGSIIGNERVGSLSGQTGGTVLNSYAAGALRGFLPSGQTALAFSPARATASLVPLRVNAGEMEVIRRSSGDDRAESDGIPAIVGRNRGQAPRWRGSGYFWNSEKWVLILPILPRNWLSTRLLQLLDIETES